MAAAVAFLPWLPDLIRTTHSPGTKLYGALEPFSLHAVGLDLPQLWVGVPFQTLSAEPGAAVLGMALAGLGLAIVICAAAAPRNRLSVPRPRPEIVLMALLALGIPALTGAYSSARASVWDSRNLIASWPAFAVMLAWLVTRPRGWRQLGPVALVVATFAIGAAKMQTADFHRPQYQAVAHLIDRAGSPGAPVVNWPDYSPGPPNELEVALALDGGTRHPVLRLGTAPLREVLHAPPYSALPAPTGQAIAAQAARLAGHGRLFLVLPADVPLSTLERIRRIHVSATPTSGILVQLGAFMAALAPRFEPVAVRSYAGVHRATVYEFDG